MMKDPTGQTVDAVEEPIVDEEQSSSRDRSLPRIKSNPNS